MRRSVILDEIDRRIGDPGLSATAMAAMLGVTPRYVHMLLKDTGRSFTHHVLNRRLEHAAKLLRDPQWRPRKIAEIAAEAGFTDLSYFNRAFRRQFAMTPSNMRAQGQAPVPVEMPMVCAG
jgi:AraC-like DNA-binding protein